MTQTPTFPISCGGRPFLRALGWAVDDAGITGTTVRFDRENTISESCQAGDQDPMEVAAEKRSPCRFPLTPLDVRMSGC